MHIVSGSSQNIGPARHKARSAFEASSKIESNFEIIQILTLMFFMMNHKKISSIYNNMKRMI